MYIKIVVEVCELFRGNAEATLVLSGTQIQSVRLGQWIEQTVSRLCKEVAQKKDGCCAP